MSPCHPFVTLGLPKNPLFLAPLAGVSDSPFRRICQRLGADLTYVEMISATALLHFSKHTLDMLFRHEQEGKLGVQVTARNAEEVQHAVAMLNCYSFETIDINMGCPVKKVVQVGCGSAIIRDPQKVYDYTKKACSVTDKPLSVKIRIGWDHQSLNYIEVADAAAQGGAAWLTVHGRTRSDSYENPVNLGAIAQIKQRVSIPVLGNGNVFGAKDLGYMSERCGVDGVMISRGALGNPWIFSHIKQGHEDLSLDVWYQDVLDHMGWQEALYGERPGGILCMRKHLIWYLKGWPGMQSFREKASLLSDWSDAYALWESVYQHLQQAGCMKRPPGQGTLQGFCWDPKYDMDRTLDRGSGQEAC